MSISTAATPRTALVTRPRAQGEAWVSGLLQAGVNAKVLPLIDIAPAPDPRALQGWFASAFSPGHSMALVMFVSPNAAQCLVDALGPQWRWPDGVIAAATGPGTAAVLRAHGVPEGALVLPPMDAAQFDSEALWPALQQRRDWHGGRVAIVRGDGGRDWLAGKLREAGAEVEFVQAYARRAPAWGPDERALLSQALAEPARFAWLLSSSEAVDHLRLLAPAGARWGEALALASHPRIAARARELGFGRVVDVAPTIDGVAQTLRSLPLGSG